MFKADKQDITRIMDGKRPHARDKVFALAVGSIGAQKIGRTCLGANAISRDVGFFGVTLKDSLFEQIADIANSLWPQNRLTM